MTDVVEHIIAVETARAAAAEQGQKQAIRERRMETEARERAEKERDETQARALRICTEARDAQATAEKIAKMNGDLSEQWHDKWEAAEKELDEARARWKQLVDDMKLGECVGHLGPPSNTGTPHPMGETCSLWKPVQRCPAHGNSLPCVVCEENQSTAAPEEVMPSAAAQPTADRATATPGSAKRLAADPAHVYPDKELAERVIALISKSTAHPADLLNEVWGFLESEIHDRVAAVRESLADDLRNEGWAVAVHNDYRQNGALHTFWLLTKGERAIKGEGRTDAEALIQIRSRAARRKKE